MKQLSIILFFVSFLSACNQKCDELNLEDIKITLEVKRLENELFNLKSPEDAKAFLEKHKVFSEKYFPLSQFPDKSALADFLYKFYTNKGLKELKDETEKKFGDLHELKSGIEDLFKHVKHYYPSFFVPELYTVVTGFQFDKDLMVSDSIMVISLDYFLGKKAKYRPPFYNYFLERYDKPYIIPMLTLAVSNKYNEVNLQDETMVANMIFYGKAYYFAKKMLPCTHDSVIVMYSGQQLEEVEKGTALIWSHFIEKKLLFETKPAIIEKYVGESPKVLEIGDKCPGRIGRWLGWEIVKRYMEENPQLTLQDLMKENDAQKIFKLSKYKPKL